MHLKMATPAATETCSQEQTQDIKHGKVRFIGYIKSDIDSVTIAIAAVSMNTKALAQDAQQDMHYRAILYTEECCYVYSCKTLTLAILV
jgi:hypothetical protein